MKEANVFDQNGITDGVSRFIQLTGDLEADVPMISQYFATTLYELVDNQYIHFDKLEWVLKNPTEDDFIMADINYKILGQFMKIEAQMLENWKDTIMFYRKNRCHTILQASAPHIQMDLEDIFSELKTSLGEEYADVIIALMQEKQPNKEAMAKAITSKLLERRYRQDDRIDRVKGLHEAANGVFTHSAENLASLIDKTLQGNPQDVSLFDENIKLDKQFFVTYVDAALKYKDNEEMIRKFAIMTGEITFVQDEKQRSGYLADFMAELICRGKATSFDLLMKLSKCNDSTEKKLFGGHVYRNIRDRDDMELIHNLRDFSAIVDGPGDQGRRKTEGGRGQRFNRDLGEGGNNNYNNNRRTTYGGRGEGKGDNRGGFRNDKRGDFNGEKREFNRDKPQGGRGYRGKGGQGPARN